MRGPFIGVVVALASAAFLLQVAAQEDTRAREVANRIDKLVTKAFGLDQKIDARIDPERIKRAGSLRNRVDEISEPTCRGDDDHQCGGDDPQCIHNLLVCDGVTDCRNGEDEKHCDAPFKKGDTYIGDQVFDHCGRLNPDHITVDITSVTTSAFFTSHPKVSATLKIHKDDEDDDREVAIPQVGFYSFATHKLILKSPDDEVLYLVGQFDGHNFDRFVGESVSVGTGIACAQFIYHRQH